MAKIIALIICITLLVGGAVTAVGSIFLGWDIFGEQTTPEHTHQYSEEITKAPTCTEEGVKTFTCSVEGCDKPTYTEPVAKLPHTEVKLEGKAATCTEAGLSEGKKCSACGEITVKQETIPAAGHKEETLAAKAPTCTETGLTAGKKCSVCDSVLEAQSSVPATGHKYDDEYDATCNNEGCDFVRDAACRHTNTETLAAKAATCTETGLTEGLRCKDCEEILTKQEIIPMVAHTWTPATCTAAKSCSVCKATEGDALGHHWKPATCTDPKTCQRENCGVTEGEALGHKWKDATCTAPQICSVCTATQGEAVGHKWNAATCDTPKTCSVCKATEGSKLSHSYNAATYVWSADNKTCTATKVCKNDPSHVVTESGKVTVQTVSASCITAGTVTYTATFTEDGFVNQTKSENVDKLPHVYGTTSYDWSDDYRSCTAVKKCTGDNCYANVSETVTSTIVTVDSTCTVKGSVTYTVDFKNAEFEDQTHVEYLPLAKHNLVSHSKPATCTETGLTEILKCTNCSYTEGTQEEIPLQPHTYDDSNGYATECSVCHTPRPACKHESLETIPGYEATCSKEGLTDGKKCKTCGETVVGQTTIPKAEHTPGAAATCTEDQICTVCKVTLNKATDHSFGKVNYEWIYNGDEIVACKATRTCQNSCGTSENETVNAEGKIVVDAKCGQPGTKTYTAVFTTNNAFKTQTKDVTIPALEHSYTSVVTNPTCTAGGYTTHTCSKCNDSYTDAHTTKLGHSFTNYKSNNDATCTADGTKTATCDRCDVTDTVADTGSKKGHSFTNYVSNNDATCTANGTETAKCDNCDETDKRIDEGSMLAHTYDKNVAENEYLKSAATCTAEAVYYKSCSCGASSEDSETPVTFNGTTVDSTNHTGTEENGGTADVHTKYSCCGATISNTHKYSSEITTPATCTEKGTTTYTCECGYHYDAQDVTALGHNYTEKVTDADHLKNEAENCQQENVYWYDCSRCDANAKDDATAADKFYNSEIAGEHSVSGEWTNADGKHFHKCEYCDYTEDEGTCSDVDTDTDHNCDVCNAEGITSHTYNQTVATAIYKATDATCTAKATYYMSCKCGAFDAEESETFKDGSSLGHDWADATCTTPKTCKRDNCGVTEGTALGHSMNDGKCDNCPVATIEKALTLEDNTPVILTGYVQSIDYAWSDANCNMSVTLRDETGDHTIYIFKLATEVGLGDYITVTGEKLNYNGTHEVVNGSATIITAHTECTPASAATCTEASVCSICGTLLAPALGHIDDDTNDRCDRCPAYVTTSTVWTLVTDVNDLVAGSKIILVSAGDSYAMGPQANNNRTAVAVTKNGSIVTFVTDVEVITLENTDIDGMLAFKVENGYLYAASSSGNQLKTKTTLDVNGKWNITIADGIATIKATESNNRNWLRFNENGGSPIFSCYTSGQKDVAIYKQSTAVVEAYGVTFDYNGNGTENYTEVVADGSLVTKPADPTMDGYNFVGWFTEDDAEFDFSAAVTESTTLVAKWEAKVYFNVIFNSNDGTPVATQNIESGYTATEPTAPTKDNHTFAGWYTDADFNNEFTFSTPITAETTLYAKWISNALPTYNVTFETDGGSDVETQVITQGEKVAEPADPTRDGYAFGGWYTNADCTEAYDFETTVAGEFTLYAKWIEIVDRTITFDDTSKRTDFSTSAQTWKENGITVTNTKASSTSNVADYFNPVRFYKNSIVAVQFDNMTKIVFTCGSSSYAEALQSAIESGVTVSVSGSNVTVIFDEPINTFSVQLSVGQVQMKSITVTAYAPCEHQSKTGVEPVCGNTVECKLCGKTYTGAHSPITVEAVAATCVDDGLTEGVKCSVCQTVIKAQETVNATGVHNYVDGICTMCGGEKPSTPSGQTQTEKTAIAATGGTLASDNLTITWESNNFTFKGNKGSSSTAIRTSDSDHFRVYVGSTFTIDSKNNQKISKIVITTTGTSYTKFKEDMDGVEIVQSGTTVTLTVDNLTSVTLGVTAQSRIKSIEITYTE